MTSKQKKVLTKFEIGGKSSGPLATVEPNLWPKHPLKHQWHLWYFTCNGPKGGNWEDNQRNVSNFDTIEDFWALFKHIELASHLSYGCDYSVFKSGIRPMWEDERNKSGGRWLFQINRSPSSGQQIDDIWLEVLMCLIGETFDEDGDQICGAVVNIRHKLSKISVWTNDCNNSGAIESIGRVLKHRTGFKYEITYEAHSDTAVKTGKGSKFLFKL